MRQVIGIAATLVILSCGAIAFGQGQNGSPPAFHSAALVSVSGVKIPFNSVATGMVELRVAIGKEGSVKDVEVVRELASVTEQSIQAVKTWKFDPATLNGKPVVSRLTVSVV